MLWKERNLEKSTESPLSQGHLNILTGHLNIPLSHSTTFMAGKVKAKRLWTREQEKEQRGDPFFQALEYV